MAMFGTARHVTEEPFLICILVAVAIQKNAIQTLAEVLGHGEWTEPQLAVIQIPGEFSFGRAFHRCLIFEEAIAVGGSIEMLADPLPDDPGEAFSTTFLAVGPHERRRNRWLDWTGVSTPLAPRIQVLLPLYRVFLLPYEAHTLRDLFQRARNSSAGQILATPESYKMMRDNIQNLDEESRSRRDGILALILWPEISNTLAALQTAETYTDLARLVLAAARFRARHGKYPDTLAALVPEYIEAVPIDAYDGKPITLKIDAKGWTVFSADADRRNKPIELTLPTKRLN